MHRYNQRLIEDMKNKQTQERSRLPKIQRSDAKTRMAMFKKSLRISTTAVTPDLERERVKQVRGHNTRIRKGDLNDCFRVLIVVSALIVVRVVCLMGSSQRKKTNGKRTRGSISTRNTRIRCEIYRLIVTSMSENSSSYRYMLKMSSNRKVVGHSTCSNIYNFVRFRMRNAICSSSTRLRS